MSTPSNYTWIDKAEKTGDLSVRVKLKRPNPAALEYFALVLPIYPKAYREKVGAEGYAKAPVGAGPYKVTKFEPAQSVEFERFEDYWAGSPKGKPAIKKMSVRFVPDAATEMTELLAGRVDWIWNMNPDQFDNVNKIPHLQAVRKESMRIGYLSLDAAGRTGADNPMTKLKVRQAIWHAIDRQAIADKLVTGGSRVPLAPCFPPQFGCDGEIAVLYDYNPAKAKAASRRGRLSQRLRRRADQLRAAAVGLGGPELPAGGRHPRQAQPAAGAGAGASARRPASCASISAAGAATRSTTCRRSCRTSSTAGPTTTRAIPT